MRLLFTNLLMVFALLKVSAQAGPQTKSFVIKGGVTSSTDKQSDMASRPGAVREMPKQGPGDRIRTTGFQIAKQGTVDLSRVTRDFNVSLMTNESEKPRQGGEKIENYNYTQNKSGQAARATISIAVPALNQNFMANTFNGGTPNDNDMAISDSGMVISVINSIIYFRDTNNDSVYYPRSLGSFKYAVNKNSDVYDPKVMYDPTKDRFVLVCLVGRVDTNSKVVVGFSKTNNPYGSWNLYLLPGNPLNNGLWTDYPMIAMTEKELFLSVNLLTNNSSWQTGFVESVIWQMKKDSGYAGNPTIGATLHSNIQFNGRAIRNLCPVKGGSKLYKPNLYFLSNRNFASQNDTVFLVNVTDTIGAPGGTVTVKALTSSQPYYFPSDGVQPSPTNSLATNDSRNLGAFFENNKIQYVHNTNNPTNNKVSVYYGVIDSPQSASPTVTGYILPNDTLNIAYPNISYAGSSSADNSAIITFDHASATIYPGCSAIQADAAGGFSPRLKIKDGSTFINVLTGTEERWGDYSGSQRRYNNPGEVWMSGYYACNLPSYPKTHAAWVAQIFTNEKFAGITERQVNKNDVSVFPNPAKDIYSVEVKLSAPEYLSFELYDSQGKMVQALLRDYVRSTDNVFSFSTRDLGKGIYILKIRGNTTSVVKKIVID